MSQDLPSDEAGSASATPEPTDADTGAVTELAEATVAWVMPAPALESFTAAPGESPELTSGPSLAEPVTPPGIEGQAVLDSVRDLGARLDRRLADLQAAFDREVRAEASRERVVDRLHAELQQYKGDLLLNTLRPVFVDLIQLHDDIGKVAVAPAEGAPEVERLLSLMRGFQAGIEDILYRQGVEPFRVEGEPFDPRRQRAVATVASDDPGLAKTVAARHRPGFQAGERVIRPEIVSVYASKK